MQQCIVCGKTYTSERGRQYCSDNCRRKKWRLGNRQKDLAQRRAYNKRRWKRVKPIVSEKHCEFCGKVFLPNRYTPKQPFCSAKCRTATYRRNNREKVNRWRRESYRRHIETKRATDARYHDKVRFGGNRIKALERDGHTCQLCGSRERLAVHHKDESGQSENPNNELENLQTLCRSCHIRIHKH